jgi:enoyl-CoA hydratase
MAYKTIVVEIGDGIAQIRLNRPEALNALSSELMAELSTAMVEADASDKVRVILLSGSEKAFAAGADIKEMAGKTYVDAFLDDLFGADVDRIRRVRKPVVAAVSGYVLGGGCELMMMCDIIIASDTAKFGQPEINLGIMAGMGGTQRLARTVGKAKAMDMNLTGRFMDAAEAERAGLVSRVVPVKKLMEEAVAVARKVAEKPMMSTLSVKEAVNRAFEVPLSDGLMYERRLFHALFSTEDQKEGMAAFLDKREPQFRDR